VLKFNDSELPARVKLSGVGPPGGIRKSQRKVKIAVKDLKNRSRLRHEYVEKGKERERMKSCPVPSLRMVGSGGYVKNIPPFVKKRPNRDRR